VGGTKRRSGNLEGMSQVRKVYMQMGVMREMYLQHAQNGA